MNKLTLSYTQYQYYLSKICRDISLSKWTPDYVVGLVRGGSLSAVMISHYFDKPCHMLKVALRDHEDTEHNCWMPEDAFGYGLGTRKNILIVDDINDTGATIDWLVDDWQSSCLPDNEEWPTIWNHNVRFATIVDNLSSKCSVKMDYVGFEINKAETDVWIDFPYENWWSK
jgi:hypoxanthine phosphoribosyltransferase